MLLRGGGGCLTKVGWLVKLGGGKRMSDTTLAPPELFQH